MPVKKFMTILILALVFFAVVLTAVFRIIGFGVKMKQARLTVGASAFSVEVASTTLARANGLSGRDGLGEDEGMYFIFGGPGNYGFWMKDMKFPIDIIWINGGKVAGFAENAAPQPKTPLWGLKIYYPPEPVDRVLEVGAGTVEKYKIKIGDSVSLTDAF